MHDFQKQCHTVFHAMLCLSFFIFREQEFGARDHQATLEHSLVTLILISILDITKNSSNNCIKSVTRIIAGLTFFFTSFINKF